MVTSANERNVWRKILTLRIILFSIIESVVRLLFRYYKKAKFLITIS